MLWSQLSDFQLTRMLYVCPGEFGSLNLITAKQLLLAVMQQEIKTEVNATLVVLC